MRTCAPRSSYVQAMRLPAAMALIPSLLTFAPHRCSTPRSKKANPYADPGAGSLLTLLQFLFIAVTQAPGAIGWRRGAGAAKAADPSGNATAAGTATATQRSGGDGGVQPVTAVAAPRKLHPLFDDDDKSAIAKAVRSLPVYLKPTVVPIGDYVRQTVLFFAMSFLNNIAFAFHISQPLHMVFRSANLLVTYVVGLVWLEKRCVVHRARACGAPDCMRVMAWQAACTAPHTAGTRGSSLCAYCC